MSWIPSIRIIPSPMFSNAKKYYRTSHVRIYNKELTYARVENVLSQKDIVSGVINMKGHLFVCFEETRVRRIGVYLLIFNDNEGTWKCNLWYSETLPQ